MTTNRDRPAAVKWGGGRGGIAIALLGLLLLSAWNASWTSFEPVVSLIKLSLALAHLAFIGFMVQRLLGLPRPRLLAGAGYVLLGQIVCLGFVYVRSILSEITGLPGISIPEVFIAEGLLAGTLLVRTDEGPPAQPMARDRVLEIGTHALWLVGLLAIASQKLDLYFTPSSDPDIHAFYSRILLDRGQLFYDLEPLSDAWMIYPSGFSCLNLILGRLAGLHAVQLVNIGPYLQLGLFAGCAFALLGRGLERRTSILGLAAVFFPLCAFAFNPLFVPGRAHLEGTPRLAHTALLFLPVFFNLEYASTIARRPTLLAIPAIAVAVGMSINPTHAPFSLLAGASALIPLVGWREPRRQLGQVGARQWIATGVLILGIMGLVMAADPFYRSFARQQLGLWPGEVEAAERLTGSAFRTNLSAASLAPALSSGWLADVMPERSAENSTHAVERSLLAIGVAGMIAIPLLRRRRSERLEATEREILTFTGLSLAMLGVHALWVAIVPILVAPGVLQSVLLVRYTDALQNQSSLALFAILAIAPIAVALRFAERSLSSPASAGRRVGWILIAASTAAVVLMTIGLLPAIRETTSSFLPQLRQSPLGELDAADVSFARSLADIVPGDERILLPGRLRRTGIEHWIFTTGAGRAVPLFGDSRTSFFLGLDGRAFTPDAYEAHVRDRFDHDWLRSQRIYWLIESGNFPPGILKWRYELVTGTDRANLWRLMDYIPGRDAPLQNQPGG